MIILPFIRTKRMSVQLRELTLGESIAICRMPAAMHEMTTTAFLRFCADQATSPQPSFVTDPRLLTVQERTRLVCLYLGAVLDDGPNFALGSGSLADYLSASDDLGEESVEVGDIGGKPHVMGPLLGVHAEMLERACEERGDWLVGAMACQLRPADMAEPDFLSMSNTDSVAWIQEQLEAMRALPESEFEEACLAYDRGTRALRHFFEIGFDDSGVVCHAKEAGSKDPARFLPLSCLSETTRRLFTRPDSPSR